MSDEHGPDAKLLCVPDRDPRFSDYTDIGELPDHQLNEIWHFFDVYKTLEPGKSTSTRGWGGVEAARQALHEALDRYQP
jgi:inorganic pyrophosphatase